MEVTGTMKEERTPLLKLFIELLVDDVLLEDEISENAGESVGLLDKIWVLEEEAITKAGIELGSTATFEDIGLAVKDGALLEDGLRENEGEIAGLLGKLRDSEEGSTEAEVEYGCTATFEGDRLAVEEVSE